MWADSAGRPGASGMAGALSEADRGRIARTGLAPIDRAEGLALLDAALRVDSPTLVPAPLDRAALGALGAQLPTVLRELAPAAPDRRRRRPRRRPGRPRPCATGSPC